MRIMSKLVHMVIEVKETRFSHIFLRNNGLILISMDFLRSWIVLSLRDTFIAVE